MPPRAYLDIADYHMVGGQFEEAQKMVDVAQSLSPGDPALLVSQGLVYALSDRRVEAEAELKKVGATEHESSRLYGEGCCSMRPWGTWTMSSECWHAKQRRTRGPSTSSSTRSTRRRAGTPRFRGFCRRVGIPPPP